MKFGFRVPSLTKRIAARTSSARFIRNNLGIKAPRGMGWATNPKKYVYNKVYQRTTKGTGCLVLVFIFGVPVFYWIVKTALVFYSIL